MKKRLLPKLRFPEFRDVGEWEKKSLGSHIEALREKSSVQDEFEVFTSARNGLIRQRDYYDNNERISDRDNVGFNIIPPNYLTYRSRSDDRRFFFNENNLGITGIISSYYPVFRLVDSSNKFFIELLSVHSNAIGKRSVGTSQTVLSLNELRRIQLPLPRINEQKKIADCLSSIDELVSAQSQKVDALKTHKKGLMQQLFPREDETIPRLRFPEFRDAGEWEILPFKEVAKFLSGGTPSKDVPEYWGGEIPWISASSMHNIKIDRSDSNITDLAVTDGARIAKKGTLLLLVRGSMLHKRVPIGVAEVDVAFNQDVKALELKGDITEHYLMSFLIASESKLLAAVTATGIGAGKLDTSDLNDFLIGHPSLKEQKKIADCLSSIDELISAQSQKLDTLKTHKKGLMQQLFPSLDE